MALVLYHYPKCSTCRKARSWLDEQGIAYELVDLVAAPPRREELARAASLAGVPVRKLFNTSGQSYRQGGFKERLPSMTDDDVLAALAADGKLIKRPLLVGNDLALVGFRAESWSRALT